MKKLLTLLLLAVLFVGNTYGQFVSYGFMSSTGTYEEITGGLVFGTESSDDQRFVDPTIPAGSTTVTGPGIPIGFDFEFNGITFDVLGINNNGWIGFGQSSLTPAVNIYSSSSYTPLSSTSTATPALYRNRISVYGRDLQAQAGASIRVETLGTAPNRETVIQFTNYKRYGSTYAGESLNFQIRLQETTNFVELVYGPMTPVSTTTGTIQVGIGGNLNSEYLNRTTTTSWENSTPGTSNSSTMAFNTTVFPASGLTYTFGPMVPLAALYSSPSNGAAGMPLDVSLQWTPDVTGGGEAVGYRVYMGTDNPPTNVANGVDVGNVLTYTAPAALELNTVYYWQIVPYNAIGDASANPIWSFRTTLGFGDLEGFVTNGFGIPLAGVNINITNGVTTYNTVTGTNGAYSFDLISAGPYTLTATLETYNTNIMEVFVDPNTTTYQNISMTRPSMAVTPNPYSVSVNPNEMVDGALNIANNGDGVLGWNATIAYTSPGPNTWLTLGQASGSVDAYTNFNLPVAFNASGLTAGTIKTAEITVTSTPNVGTVVIPVTMSVNGVALVSPTNLVATLSNPIAGNVNLSWSFESTPSFQFFVVKRNGVQVGTTTGTTFANTLPAYGTYDYTVQAVFADGNSAPAGPVQIIWANPTIVVDPISLFDEVWVNNQAVQTVTISNTGEGTLAFSFPEWANGDGSRAPLAYCTASGGCDEYISNVTFGDINNNSTCGGYSDFTAISTDVEMGETYELSVTNPNAYSSDITGVWIDWNHNESFTDAGEFFTTTSSGGGANFSASILIPETAQQGPTRMRVRLQYGGTLAPCGTTSYGDVEDYTLNVKLPGFIVAVSPASGQVAAGESRTVSITYDATGFEPGSSYFEPLVVESNDIANPSITIQNEMYVYEPGMIAGTVTSAVDGSPIDGATVVAGDITAMTNADGNYSITIDAGTYSIAFSKTGFTTVTVEGVVVTETGTTVVDAELEEVFYPVTFVHAEVNEADTQAEVTWGTPIPDYEVLYDDGTAENFTAWALAGNMNAVKFTPAGYPATVYGGKIYVGDGSFPNNNTGFIGTTFGAMVMDDSGANGMPGAVIDSVEVTVNNYGWVVFTGLDATIESGSFYLVMVQGGISPNVAPVGVDQTTPTAYRSYSRNVVAGQAWGLSPYQDMMIRALVSGPASDDNVRFAASTEVRSAMKQRGMISLTPATAQSGAEGDAQYRAVQNEMGSRDITGYSVWRIAVADPDAGAASGTLTLLNNNVASTNYTDNAFGPLPEGWYAYAVAANYTNGGQSELAYSNIVGHKKFVDVTVNVSLTTGGSPEGAVVTLTGSIYPHDVLTQTVPADGQVIFEDVVKGPYTILAQKVGFDNYVIEANIQTNRTFNIILAERKYKPRNLYVDPLTLVATWDEPLAIAVLEDFEGATFPPAGWQAITQNTTGWYGTTNGSSSAFVIPPHTKYAVTNDDAANGDGCCDILMTPVMDWTDLPSYRLNFASYYDGSYAQSAYVEISTDNGATWTIINTLAPAPGAWQNLEIDLASYSGATGLGSVMVAFHADDNGEWASGWAIDDVQIASGGVPMQGYGVFLDGTLVGNTPETTWTYTNLNYGQTYEAGVAALFSSGYSELDTYRFTSVYLIPPTNLEGVNPESTDYVHLTWLAPTVSTTANQDALPVIVAQPAADVATVVNARPFAQTSVPLASSRVVLFDNGPLVNSPGTGSGGADESILQGSLGMTTYGSGMQQTAGNSVADDFTVTGTWNVESFEFFGYQTGSTTTSTFTGVFYRIWDGNPTAGGQVIYGDLTTNKMVSTEWANIYRNDNGPGGSTDRPVMRIVASADGLSLPEGEYWVEWTTTGSLSSGPWVPAVTIEGQTTTGNALQNQSGSWVALTDVGPQGMPFIINGNGGGGPGVSNLIGYNIYRDEALIAFVEEPALEYFDLDLYPATYSYHITAVYDLTPYGFAGQTGESMIEGPINVDVIFGYELPFTENFTTGVFETNQWTVNGGNWSIAGQAGNPAPAAQFSYAPVVTGYEQSIESYYLIGSNVIDGSIKLDFDLKHTLINASETESLVVEVNNGSGWAQVAEYKNTANIEWETKNVDITSRAKGHVFRIRFVAKGENTTNINNWLVDNVHVYSICEAPTNLVAAINAPYGDQILLTWEGPNTPPPGPSGWLFWDNGTNADAIGLQGGGTFNVAVRFTPAQLAEYAGTSLTKIRMFPFGAGGTLVLKVWTGANASQLVLSQPVATYTVGQWNEFNLNTPVMVTGTTELWFGYEVTHGAEYVAGCDAGPAVAGYGDMISLDGAVWESMSQAYALNYNWNLQGWVESVDGVSALQPIRDNGVYGPVTANAKLTNSGVQSSSNVSVFATDNMGSRDLTGYNVYREGVLIATTTETTYLDADPAISILGEEWCYTVTAVYEGCESEFSNVACEVIQAAENLTISAVNVYPNPSNSVVNLELTDNISQFVVFNYTGQVIMEQSVAKAKTVQIDVRNYEAGAYLIKFITRSGESFTKKIAVTK